MHRTRFIFGISVLFLAAGIVVTAQQGNVAPKSTHTTTPAKPNPVNPAAAKPAAPKAASATATTAKSQTADTSKPATQAATTTAAASGTKSQVKPGKPDAAASKTPVKSAAPIAKSEKTPVSKVAKADGKTAKSDKVTDTKVAKADKKSDKSKTTASAPTTQLTPVQQRLKDNTNLAGKIESRLPKGTNLMTAADGFRDLGQFIAAVNVANNLNVSFDELKAKIVTNKMSLGQAIQAVRPLTASPTIEAQRAEYDARGLIAETAQPEASPAPKTHGPVTTPASTPTTSNTVKAKPKTTKTSAQ